MQPIAIPPEDLACLEALLQAHVFRGSSTRPQHVDAPANPRHPRFLLKRVDADIVRRGPLYDLVLRLLPVERDLELYIN